MAYSNVKVKARQTVAQTNTQTKDLGTVSEVPMGDWSNTTPYKKLNLVRYNGATYIATQDNQGATPTGSGIWQLVNADGRGIQSTLIAYQASVSGTTPPTGEWVSQVPNVPQGQYLWTRVIYIFTDGTQTVAYSVSLQGLNFTQQDRDDIDRITDAIPSTASADNPLATHDFVNSSINAMAAFYITYNAAGNAFPTKASLTGATTFYNAGQVRVPTQNDYATVLSDESQTQNADGTYPTTRYVYQGGTYPNGQWELSFIVNTTTFTQAQLDALNSGITQQKIASQDNAIAGKVSKSGDTMTGGLGLENLFSNSPQNNGFVVPFNMSLDPTTPSGDLLQSAAQILKRIKSAFPTGRNDKTFFGRASNSWIGTYMANVYMNESDPTQELPQYSSGILITRGTQRLQIWLIGTENYVLGCQPVATLSDVDNKIAAAITTALNTPV